MRAADYAIRHYNRLRALALNELENLLHDDVIVSNVTFLRKPALECHGRFIISSDDPNTHLCSNLIVGSIERYGSDRITAESAPRLFRKRLLKTLLEDHGVSLAPRFLAS